MTNERIIAALEYADVTWPGSAQHANPASAAYEAADGMVQTVHVWADKGYSAQLVGAVRRVVTSAVLPVVSGAVYSTEIIDTLQHTVVLDGVRYAAIKHSNDGSLNVTIPQSRNLPAELA